MLKAFKYFILLFFTTLSLVSLTSCDEEKKNGPDNTSSDIVGRWRVTHISGYEKENGRIVDSWDEDVDEYDESLVYNFKRNGELIIYEYYDGHYDEERGFWEIDGKKLYLDIYDEDEEWDIKTLTSSRLVITARFKYGTSEDYYEYTFSKEK